MNNTYCSKMFINNQNKKAKHTDIINVDTIRGCANDCESCFAKRNSAITIKHFETPVPIKSYSGKVRPDKYYRFGNFGDPATDWKHSEKLIKKYNFKNFFAVTKLQTLKGYSGIFDKLQVSLDPLNEEHFYITLDNIKQLRKNYPNTQIILRIRSLGSKDLRILKRQKEAINYANLLKLPVLETKMRFISNIALKKYKLIQESYSWRHSYLRSKKGKHFLKNVDQHFICDIKEKKCQGCKLCIKLFWRRNDKN